EAAADARRHMSYRIQPGLVQCLLDDAFNLSPAEADRLIAGFRHPDGYRLRHVALDQLQDLLADPRQLGAPSLIRDQYLPLLGDGCRATLVTFVARRPAA